PLSRFPPRVPAPSMFACAPWITMASWGWTPHRPSLANLRCAPLLAFPFPRRLTRRSCCAISSRSAMTGAQSRMRADFWGNLERRMDVEWLAVTVSMLALTTLLCVFSSRIGLERIDHAFYDRVLSTAMHPDPSSDIVIVAIDDGSIEQIGYWPWRRALHAQ